MKNETAIKAFVACMASLNYKDWEVRSNPEQTEFNVGFTDKFGQFVVDADIQVGKIWVVRKPDLNHKRSRRIKVDGFIVIGYRPIPATRWEPPDVAEFEIGGWETLSEALQGIVLYYVKENMQNHWEGAYMDEMANEQTEEM